MMAIRLMPGWAGDGSDCAEWHAYRHGRYLGSILWLERPMLFRVLPDDRRISPRDNASLEDAIAYLEDRAQ